MLLTFGETRVTCHVSLMVSLMNQPVPPLMSQGPSDGWVWNSSRCLNCMQPSFTDGVPPIWVLPQDPRLAGYQRQMPGVESFYQPWWEKENLPIQAAHSLWENAWWTCARNGLSESDQAGVRRTLSRSCDTSLWCPKAVESMGASLKPRVLRPKHARPCEMVDMPAEGLGSSLQTDCVGSLK